jgi:predicted dithiol-disulfide oxidoreductase (DUF899 family)
MNTTLHHVSFPGESPEYRIKRNALLEQEMSLRRQVEAVAAQRRALPLGGASPEDYRFIGNAGPVAMSAMFTQGKDTLAMYSFMFGPEREEPCPGCTPFLDGLDGMVEHISQRINFAVVAKSPIERLQALARQRGWERLPLYSTAGNNFDRDYFGDSSALSPAVRKQQEFKDGEEWDMPMLNVFRQAGGKVRHFWGSEVLYVPPEPGQEYRHNDLLNPLWNMLDLTPAGRGDFHPRLAYP